MRRVFVWFVILLSAAFPGEVKGQLTPEKPEAELALINAARNGRLDEVEALLKGGVTRLSVQDDTGHNALMWALEAGHPQIAAALIRQASSQLRSQVAASVNGRGVWTELNVPPLITLALVKTHLLTDADAQGWTPLMRAADKGYSDIVQLLLDEDVPISPRNAEGLSAAEIAARAGQAEIARKLAAGR